MIPLSHHNGPTVLRGMVFGAKSKNKMELPLSTVPQSPIPHGAVFLTPPAGLNSSVAGTDGTRTVQGREGDNDGGGIGRGVFTTQQ